MSRIFHHTILKNKLLQYDIKVSRFLANRGVGIVEPGGSRLTPSLKILPVSLCLNPQEDNAKFFENSRRVLRKVHLEPVDLQKRFLMYPMSSVYETPIIPRGLGILMGWLGTWGYSRAARSFRIIKFSCVAQGILLVRQALNLSQEAIHGRRILPLLHGEFIDFQLSSSIRKFFGILQLLGNLLRDLPDKVCFAYPILQIASFFPLSLISQLVRLIKLHSLGFKLSAGLINKEQYPIQPVNCP